jgi:hypothetical protein
MVEKKKTSLVLTLSDKKKVLQKEKQYGHEYVDKEIT